MKRTTTMELPEVASDAFHGMREAARERFNQNGWPDRRVEAYKYTSLVRFNEKHWQRLEQPGEIAALPAALGDRLLWVDGHVRNPPSIAGLRLLRDRNGEPDIVLTRLLGKLASPDDPIVALNTALFDHGAYLDIPADAAPEQPMEIVHAIGTQEAPGETHARLAIHLGKGARMTLVERFVGDCNDALVSRVSEIDLEAGAELVYVRINEAGPGPQILGYSAIRLGEKATYRGLTLDLGAKLAREAFRIDLAGDAAATDLTGLALTDGRRHADSDVLITHNATHTTSRQNFRGILDGRSRSVYSGKVLVATGAQKSVSTQNSANLLLSPKAEADTRPQLEIYANDVRCDHGAATGAIDPDALFYLQSRGISADAAKRMIAYGFAAHCLEALHEHRLFKPLTALLAEHMQAPTEVREWL